MSTETRLSHGFGFGMMRLPRKDEAIDIEATKALVDAFLAAGFTYFDTAWSYPGSEEAVGEALVKRHPRSSFQLATKVAAWRVKSADEAKAQLATSLERTGAGFFDYYLLHNLGEHRTKAYDDFGIWDFAQEKKREGLVRHVGFSFHSTPEELDALLKAHPEVDFVQLQLNYADWNNPVVQSRGCHEVARRHGKLIIVMEPVKGGMLANPPQSVMDIFEAAVPNRSAACWALRFAAHLDGVMVVLSGMNTMEQVRDNIACMQSFSDFSANEEKAIQRAQEALARIPVIPCTSCNYCAEVCPGDIGISGSFTAMNYLSLYGNMAAAKHQENWLVTMHQRKRADECLQCGACEEVCPQHIHIREELKKVCATFGIGNGEG